MSPQAETVTNRLESTFTHWWMFSLGTGVILAACVSLGSLAVFAVLVALLRLSQTALVVLSLLWLALTILVFATLVVRLVRFRRSLEATARRVELECPEVGSHLINLVQLAESNGHANDDFRQAALAQAAAAVADFPFEKAARNETRWRRFWLCMQTPRDLARGLAVAGGRGRRRDRCSS